MYVGICVGMLWLARVDRNQELMSPYIRIYGDIKYLKEKTTHRYHTAGKIDCDIN